MQTKLQPGQRVYFMGIGGTGMAAVAGLCKDSGYQVSGSDKGVYPPMSDMLTELAIPYAVPYAVENLQGTKPDLIVVANALSRGNPEVEYMLDQKLAYTSFPAFLGDHVLKQRTSIVVAGTHGKTTTTSITAHILRELGEEPGYLIGGIPRNFKTGFDLGKGDLFAIEGDEYDTAFFDKGSKFLHYCPKYVLLNNLEFDHADIFKDLAAIEAQFTKLCNLVADPRTIIANVDDDGIAQLLQKNGYWSKVTRVATAGGHPEADVKVVDVDIDHKGPDHSPRWKATITTRLWKSITVYTQLAGAHNIANIAQVISLLELLAIDGKLKRQPTVQQIVAAVASFAGVKRRLDLLGHAAGVDVYEDFAHHPTAIAAVIGGFRKMFPQKRLIVAFEPANATGRRNVLQHDFAEALRDADQIFLGKCPVDVRIPEAERMDTIAMAKTIGPAKAKAFNENEDLLEALVSELHAGDAVIFMSSSSFSGIQHRLAGRLKLR